MMQIQSDFAEFSGLAEGLVFGFGSGEWLHTETARISDI